MKVLTISHRDLGGGYTVPADDFAVFAVDFEMELQISPDKCGYEEIEIPFSLELLKTLKVGDKTELGVWSILCTEMSKEDYNALPEFSGW